MSKEFDDLKMHGIRNRQKYLNETDWCVIKRLESVSAEDQVMKDKRQLARDELSLLRDATTFAEIENLTIEF